MKKKLLKRITLISLLIISCLCIKNILASAASTYKVEIYSSMWKDSKGEPIQFSPPKEIKTIDVQHKGYVKGDVNAGSITLPTLTAKASARNASDLDFLGWASIGQTSIAKDGILYCRHVGIRYTFEINGNMTIKACYFESYEGAVLYDKDNKEVRVDYCYKRGGVQYCVDTNGKTYSGLTTAKSTTDTKADTKNDTKTDTKTTHTVTFYSALWKTKDENGNLVTLGFASPSGDSMKLNNGTGTIEVENNKTTVTPTVKSNAYVNDGKTQLKFLGWASPNAVYDGGKYCVRGSYIAGGKDTHEITKDITYYACFYEKLPISEETKKSTMYATGSDAVTDKSSINCNDPVDVSFCYINASDSREYCYSEDTKKTYYLNRLSNKEVTCNSKSQQTVEDGIITFDSTKYVDKDNVTIQFSLGSGAEKVSETTGKVQVKVSSLSNLKFPQISRNAKIGDYYVSFLGWNTDENCGISTMESAGNTVPKTSATYYACFTETYNQTRHVLAGASATSGKTLECGDAIYARYRYNRVDGTNITPYFVASTSSSSSDTFTVYLNRTAPTRGEIDCSTNTVTDATSVVNGTTSVTSGQSIDCSSINVSVIAQTGTNRVNICYSSSSNETAKRALLEKVYGCDTLRGYSLSHNSSYPISGTQIKGSNGVIVETWSATCTKGNASRPTIEVSPGIAGNTGLGSISFIAQAHESGATVDKYYFSRYYKIPDILDSNWKTINGNSVVQNVEVGTFFLTVMDSYGNRSNLVSASIIDTKNSANTASKLELYDSNNNVQTLVNGTSAFTDNLSKSSHYVRLSNELRKDSSILADGFNPYETLYELEVEGPTVSVYATLTSKDAKYVEGYEPRTVNLSYGINTVLIKIQDKEGKIRTYTILVTRKDDRTSDNTLSNIKLSTGKIKFNANVTDYKVEISKNTKSVEVATVISSDKAKYVEGYEPGKVDITGDTTVKLIKVMSETGSTRTYVITFVKEGTDKIEKESLQLRNLVIPGVYMPFESDVANYSVSVGYETDSITIYPELKDDSSGYWIREKIGSNYSNVSNNTINLNVGENYFDVIVKDNDGNMGSYKVTVIRKEFGLEVSNDTGLKDLRVLGYNIDFKNDKKEYTLKIKREKTLVITAVPASNRAEVFIYGNEELTGFSTVRVKVIAENGEYELYSIDIKKDPFNKVIEIAALIVGGLVLVVSSVLIVKRKNKTARREYLEE